MTEVRKTVREDRAALVGIIERTENLTAEERECAVELLDIYLNDSGQKDYYFITATMDGVPAGYACYGPRPLATGVHDLYWIIVDESRRGEGLGRKLVDETERRLLKGGARMLIAETSGLPSYGGTRDFYKRCGFSEEARIKDFYKPGDDIIFYVKRFTQKAK